jgi:predicted acyltransferase
VETGTTGRERLLSLDVFRGLTIAGMVLVNNPGSWDHVYPPLLHAEWDGWTPTDLIFPFFLFIVGVSMSLAFASRAREARGALLRKVVRRSLTLFGIGLFMAAFPRFQLGHVRIPGVLQRIAVCYLSASVVVLYTRRRTQYWIVGVILVGYWLLMRGDLSVEGSLSARLDRLVLGGHLWKARWDPEGILSTFPAIATTLIGYFIGERLRDRDDGHEMAASLFALGWILVLVGLVWSIWFPINKNLWTSSYVVFTAGAALQFLAFLYWVVDVKKWKGWTVPAVVFGRNAIAIFVLSGLVAKSMILYKVERSDGSTASLYQLVYEKGFASWAGALNGSLAFALATILFWWLVLWVLYRRRIFITI